MNRLLRMWYRLRGASCYTCRYAEAIRTTGDGQVSRLTVVCRNPASPHANQLIPPERWCEHWEPHPTGRELPRMEDTGLTP
ncbi:MAG: hypothetical protein GXO55_09140 [Chloroflexi bacterium]|nr:hypothetical protein [Chloroflexota bacterium]